MGPALWDWLMRNLPRALEAITPLDTAPKPQSGQGKPETEQEQRAAAATDANERKALNDKLEELAIGTGHLADYIGQTAIGGPEGTPGESGLGAGLSPGAYQTLFREGPLAGQYDRVVQAATAQGICALAARRHHRARIETARCRRPWHEPGHAAVSQSRRADGWRQGQ